MLKVTVTSDERFRLHINTYPVLLVPIEGRLREGKAKANKQKNMTQQERFGLSDRQNFDGTEIKVDSSYNCEHSTERLHFDFYQI